MREDICVDNISILFPDFVTQKIAKLFDGDFLGYAMTKAGKWGGLTPTHLYESLKPV